MKTIALKHPTRSLESLFEDFFQSAKTAFEALERMYQLQGVVEGALGPSPKVADQQAQLRGSFAWQALEATYDYAINGIEPGTQFDGVSSLVIDANDALELASGGERRPCDEWEAIIWMADGRSGLDDGLSIPLEKIALLAKVDIRTVRNAASARELTTFFNSEDDLVHADNASARRWLLGRRGFRPTVTEHMAAGITLDEVTTPVAFSAMLKTARKELSREIDIAHPAVTATALSELESGIFTLPLDAVFPVADFYQLDRKKFLICVMQTFFSVEFHTIESNQRMETGATQQAATN